MDHYLLVLASVESCEAENAKVQDVVCNFKAYLRQKNVTESSAKLYHAVLYTKEYEIVQQRFDSCGWTLCHENVTTDEVATLCVPSPSKLKKCKKQALEDVIHKLCDELPILGTCLVDVICVTQKTEDLPTLEERVELFGCLSRLILWHRANITMCYSCNDDRMVKTSNWENLLPLRSIQSPFDWDQLFVRNTTWRGGIHLHDQLLGGFQLTSSAICSPSIVKDCHFLNDQIEASMKDGHYLDGVMTVLGRFPLGSIPPHAVSSKCFQLSLSTSSLLTENSEEFLSRANSDENVCVMLRLGIWTITNTDDNLMNTFAWKKNVVAGNLKVPDGLNRKEVGHRLFLLIGDGFCTNHSATIYALRNTEDYNQKTCLHMALSDANRAVEPTSDRLEHFIKDLPSFSSQDVMDLRETILEKQILGIRHLIDKLGNEVPATYIQSISKEIGSSIISKFKKSIKAKKRTALVSNGISPGDEKSEHFLMMEKMKESANWPERMFLKRKDCHQTEHTLNPKEATFLKVDELLTRLQSVENCKANISALTRNYDGFPPSPQFKPCWPEAAYGNFPDVYYCSDQSREAKQQRLNCLEAKHIVYDTASSLKNNSEEQMTPRLLPLIQCLERSQTKKMTPKKQSIRKQPVQTQVRSAKDMECSNRKGTTSTLSEKNLKKLRIAVVDALELRKINLKHPLFKPCAKKLFTICHTFAKDIIGTGSASKIFMEIAESHVEQVVHFEMKRPTLNLRDKKTPGSIKRGMNN